MNHQKGNIGLIFLLLFLTAGCGRQEEVYFESTGTETAAGLSDSTEQIEKEEIWTETDTEESDSLCYVYVCGAVNCPGVYLLQEGSRVYEAIALAGGFCEDAAREDLNQAEPVSDGQMIQVLTEAEAAEREAAEPAEAAGQSAEADDGLININTATAEMLMTLPGVGQSKADSIIAYREENGAFSSVDAIKNVNGIKDGVYNQIKDKIKVD